MYIYSYTKIRRIPICMVEYVRIVFSEAVSGHDHLHSFRKNRIFFGRMRTKNKIDFLRNVDQTVKILGGLQFSLWTTGNGYRKQSRYQKGHTQSSTISRTYSSEKHSGRSIKALFLLGPTLVGLEELVKQWENHHQDDLAYQVDKQFPQRYVESFPNLGKSLE